MPEDGSRLAALEAPIARFLKVPPQPEPPLGDPRSVRIFRASPAFFRYRLLGWGVKQLSALVGIVIGLAFLKLTGWSFNPLDFIPFVDFEDSVWAQGFNAFYLFELLAIAFFLVQLPISYLLIALDYHYRWYVTTDRSLRIREGLWKVQERTMTYSNIQNISVHQGPVQRLFGIADLKVRTAGGGDDAGGQQQNDPFVENLHIGYFRGLTNAAEVRDGILARLRQLRAAGLGDPDEPALSEPAAEDAGRAEDGPELLAAAQQVLEETRALAAAVRCYGTAAGRW